jgi:hypothetical protein
MQAGSANLLSLSVALPLHSVELVYGFEENKPSGAFTLTINR